MKLLLYNNIKPYIRTRIIFSMLRIISNDFIRPESNSFDKPPERQYTSRFTYYEIAVELPKRINFEVINFYQSFCIINNKLYHVLWDITDFI